MFFGRFFVVAAGRSYEWEIRFMFTRTSRFCQSVRLDSHWRCKQFARAVSRQCEPILMRAQDSRCGTNSV